MLSELCLGVVECVGEGVGIMQGGTGSTQRSFALVCLRVTLFGDVW